MLSPFSKIRHVLFVQKKGANGPHSAKAELGISSFSYYINLQDVALRVIEMFSLYVVKSDEFHLRYNQLVGVFHQS